MPTVPSPRVTRHPDLLVGVAHLRYLDWRPQRLFSGNCALSSGGWPRQPRGRSQGVELGAVRGSHVELLVRLPCAVPTPMGVSLSRPSIRVFRWALSPRIPLIGRVMRICTVVSVVFGRLCISFSPETLMLPRLRRRSSPTMTQPIWERRHLYRRRLWPREGDC
jgi:hypothetical protein